MTTSSSSHLGVAIIGSGAMGTAHIKRWQAHPQAQVRVIVDVDQQRAAQLAADWNIPAWVTDYHAAVARDDINIVVVCVPTVFHPPVTMAAIAQGKHVLCEKPIALSLSDGSAMITAAEEAGVQLSIGLMRRHSAVMSKLADWLADGPMGRPALYHIENRFPIRPKLAMHDANANGGPFIDMMCHYVDTWRTVFRSEPISVMAHGLSIAAGRPEIKHIKEVAIDTGTVSVRFASGDVGSYTTTWGLPPGAIERPQVVEQIYAPGGLARLQFQASDQQLDWHGENGHHQLIISSTADMIAAEIDQFIQAVQGNAILTVTGKDGLAALRVSLAALEASRSGQSVSLN